MHKMIVVSLCLVLLTGCFQREKPVLPKEGDIVTWKQNDHLVVKAKLGPRRIHIPDTHCKRCEAEFYQPEHEQYIGQFPIDYVPEKFPKISVVEAESLPFPYSNGQLEFDLMLNGSTAHATDRTINSDQGLDHPDQVKVRLLNTRLDGRTSDVINYRLKNKPNDFNAENSNKYGMQCWRNQSTDSLQCYGQSKHKVDVGVLFKNMGGDQSNWVLAKSWEPLYGGITIEWSIDKRNLHRWKEVDAAIWRLLESWNVSLIFGPKPVSQPYKSKQGNLVIWSISSDLTIKTVVGDKKNIAQGTVLTSPFLGQFPINFIPKIKTLNEDDTIENVADFEHPMQFNLLLNNAKNIEINNFYDKNHQNQVKVQLQNRSTLDPTYFKYKKTPREWINYFTSQEVIKDKDLFTKFDLECYSLKNLKSHISRFYHCIGHASDPYHSEFLMKIHQHARSKQIVVTTEVETPLYPNVSIEWTMSYESLKDWKTVDQNIWRLLKAWNVKK